MRIEITELRADLADLDIVDKNGKKCFTLMVQQLDSGRLIVSYTAFDGEHHANMAFAPPAPAPARIVISGRLTEDEKAAALAKPLRTVAAVKSVRNRLGVSLLEAKNMVDEYRASMGFNPNT